MHELSLVSALVDECNRRADGKPVSVVRVRCHFPEVDEELLQCFTMLTTSTPLEDATLEIEDVPVEITCDCGYVSHGGEDVVEHMFVCPRCSKVQRVTDATLELVEVRLA